MNNCILFVEDNEDDQFLLLESIKRSDLNEIQTHIINNGQDLLGYLEDNKSLLDNIDLILCFFVPLKPSSFRCLDTAALMAILVPLCIYESLLV